MNKILKYGFLVVFYFLIHSCETQANSAISSNSNSKTSVASENKIVFLFFEIEKDATGLEKIIHTDTKITNGILKSGSIENKPNIPGNLRITMIGSEGNIVEERLLEDPLNPMMEVYAEDGLSKEKLHLDKAGFSVRFNQTGKIRIVKIEKINGNSLQHLITLKL